MIKLRQEILLLFIFFFLNSSVSYSQYWLDHGTGATNNMAYAVAVDNSGNTYTTGYFSLSIRFDAVTVLHATGPIDMFLVKTSSSGQILWAIKGGGSNVTEGLSLALDNDSNIVVTGFFYGTATFGTQTLTSNGQQDVFLAKYDTHGNFLWAVNAGGSGVEAGNKVTCDISGDILVTGEFSSTNFQAGSHTLSAVNNSLDIFTAKFDPSGICQWAKSGSSPYIDRGTQITTDVSGNVYVAGEFSDTVQFDQLHYNVMFNALFIIKYNSSGQEQWFRWMGCGNTAKMKGLAMNADGELIALGNYTNALNYFGFPTSYTLSNSYQNNYFISKISTTGDLIWSATNGSDSPVSAECLSVKPNRNIVVGGTYQCRFNDFANIYGQGVFCSLGFNDCFVADYDNAGTFLWSRCFGSINNDFLNGLATDDSEKICTAGAFTGIIYFPEVANHFSGNTYGGSNVYCNDSSYNTIAADTSQGNTDIYFGKQIDTTRQVFDFFHRDNLSLCIRDFSHFCINNCDDSVEDCSGVLLTANTFTNISPDFQYLWSTGETTQIIEADTTNEYTVQITSADGCWSGEDTIHVIIHTPPPIPLITDSKGINTNALPTTLPISLCYPDSVILTATIPLGCTFQWISTSITIPNGVNPITVDTTNVLFITVTDSFGCSSTNEVAVFASQVLPVIFPVLVCVNDSDRNDTINLCHNSAFVMLIYDTITNPNLSEFCVPGMSYAVWTTGGGYLQYPNISYCWPGSTNFFDSVTTDGWYTINVEMYRDNFCDTDSFFLTKTIYINVYPTPPDTFSFPLTGNLFICPGDSTTLTVQGSAFYTWSNNSNGSMATFYQAGSYFVNALRDTTTPDGCQVHQTSHHNFVVSQDPLPVVTTIPADAIVCPFDSVQLTCTGTGSFVWQGPNGLENSNADTIYVSTPGLYYCLRDDSSCVLNSNNVQVSQYNTPLLVPLSTPSICNNQPVDMQIIAGAGSTINWLPPYSGSSPTQTVTVPGTYSCIVTSCNISSHLSLTFPGSNPVATINYNSLVVCQGDSVNLSASHASQYLWLPSNDTLSNIYAITAGQYNLIITDSLNCQAEDSVVVQVNPNFLQPPVTTDTNLCAGNNAVLVASGHNIIHWLDKDQHPVTTGQILNTGALSQDTYYLLYSDSGGCRSAFDSVLVTVNDCDTFHIPNVITPGNDGLNDYFPGKNQNGMLFDMQIFNRWGRTVFETHENSTGWDGKSGSGEKLPDGTYYYILSVKFVSGHVQENKGWLYLKWEH